MTGAQAYYFEEPESQRVHLVRENISPYDQKWFVGLRFLESRKPYRSTGLPQDVCWGLQSAVWLLSRKLNTEEESIPAGNYISGKHWLFYPSNNVSNLRKLLKYLCHYLPKMISRVQGKNRYFFPETYFLEAYFHALLGSLAGRRKMAHSSDLKSRESRFLVISTLTKLGGCRIFD